MPQNSTIVQAVDCSVNYSVNYSADCLTDYLTRSLSARLVAISFLPYLFTVILDPRNPFLL